MIQLPDEIIVPENEDPKKLFIFSNPKIGKTTLAAGLPNALLIDMEHGSDFVSAKKIKASSIQDLREIATAIMEENRKLQGFKYDYIILDTATALEDIVRELALTLYQRTAMGKSFTGNVLSLPNGAGYQYLRDAYDLVYKSFDRLSKCLILFGHVKKASINKSGEDLMIRDIDLTGKIKNSTAADMDAIGFLYRKDNTNILSFKTTSDDLVTGARSPHLRNKEIIVSEYDPVTNEVTTHWERIFTNLATKK